MECVSIETSEMDERQVSNLDQKGGKKTFSIKEREATSLCTLVSTSCNECVTKSRMTGDGQVRFCEQLRDEISLG